MHHRTQPQLILPQTGEDRGISHSLVQNSHAKARGIVEALGGQIATTAEARALLGLPPRAA